MAGQECRAGDQCLPRNGRGHILNVDDDCFSIRRKVQEGVSGGCVGRIVVNLSDVKGARDGVVCSHKRAFTDLAKSFDDFDVEADNRVWITAAVDPRQRVNLITCAAAGDAEAIHTQDSRRSNGGIGFGSGLRGEPEARRTNGDLRCVAVVAVPKTSDAGLRGVDCGAAAVCGAAVPELDAAQDYEACGVEGAQLQRLM